ncbi:Hypothetical protein PBC10988_15530 [Planctomycetales bacterium 10988]|nr:Hypothetical protein PBC10988_15530 [Planctomycetales bacterium 10988]
MQEGVSIIIPVWNHELTIARAVRSAIQAVKALQQEGYKGEVIVLDNCSRDGTRNLLRQLEALYYQDQLKVIYNEKNLGLTQSRNKGLKLALFRGILFLDSDNLVVPENLPIHYQAMRENEGAAVFGNLLLYSSSSLQSSVKQFLSAEAIQNKIFQGNYVDAMALFDRQQLLDHGGYDQEHPALADWELWLSFISQGRKVLFVPVVLGCYFRLKNSLIAQNHGPEIEAMYRKFDQEKLRALMKHQSNHLVYHPAIGSV